MFSVSKGNDSLYQGRMRKKEATADDKICQIWGIQGHEARLTEEIINEGGKLVKDFVM